MWRNKCYSTEYASHSMRAFTKRIRHTGWESNSHLPIFARSIWVRLAPAHLIANTFVSDAYSLRWSVRRHSNVFSHTSCFWVVGRFRVCLRFWYYGIELQWLFAHLTLLCHTFQLAIWLEKTVDSLCNIVRCLCWLKLAFIWCDGSVGSWCQVNILVAPLISMFEILPLSQIISPFVAEVRFHYPMETPRGDELDLFSKVLNKLYRWRKKAWLFMKSSCLKKHMRVLLMQSL